MTHKLLSLLAVGALLLCSACAVTPTAGAGDWMHEVSQNSTPYGTTIFDR